MLVYTLTADERKRHLIIWGIITCYLSIFDPIKITNTVGLIIGTGLVMSNYMISYYLLSLVILPRYWKRKPFYLVLWILLMWLFFLVTFRFYNVELKILFGEPIEYSTYAKISEHSILFFILVVASSSFFLRKLNLEKLKEQNKREQSLMIKELNFLKNQFNSHITFNFLNFCYSHVHLSSPEAAEAIEMFSDMLRYTLTVKPDEKIALNKEVNYIKDFIELQKLLSDRVFAEFEIEGRITDQKILPRVLINFVENAFKHGVVNDPKKPLKIRLRLMPGKLVFGVENHMSHQVNVMNTGVGQDNTQQVLDLYYKDRYVLDISRTDSKYVCWLTIDLQKT